MKKVLLSILFLSLWIFPIHALELNINSQNAILYNLDEAKILYEKNAEEQIAVASLTKLMTAIVVAENSKSLDEKVILLASDFKGLDEANASQAGFHFGQIVTIRDLLYGLLLPSGADAAQALTRHIAGSKAEFVRLMNEKVVSLGLRNTHFMNATGLDEENHYSTVKDMAVIFQYALQNPALKVILQSSTYTMSDHSFTVFSTIDKNIKRYHLSLDYILGGKTGTTNNAGLCLATIASKNGTNYMLVTARAPYPASQPYAFLDARTIYDYFIHHFKKQIVMEKGDLLCSLQTEFSKEKSLAFYAEETIQKYLPISFQKSDVYLQYEGVKKVSYRSKKGTKLGTIKVIYQEEVLDTLDIVLDQKLHFSMIQYIKAHLLAIMLILFVVFIGFILFQKIKKENLCKK